MIRLTRSRSRLFLELGSLVTERVDRELLAVLLHQHRQRLELGGGGMDDEFDRGGGSDELLRLVDLDGRSRHAARGDVGAAGGEREDQEESEEIFHPVMITGFFAVRGGRILDHQGPAC